PAPPGPATSAALAAGVWRQMWEQGLHLGLIPTSVDPRLQQRAAQLLQLAQGSAQAQALLGDNRELWQQFERTLAHERGTVDGVLDLFAMLVAHVGEVFAGDSAAALEFGTLQQVCRRPLERSRIDLARSVMEPWLRRQAALQRSALEARATSREVVGSVVRGLGTFLEHNGRFNQSLQQDLGRLESDLDQEALRGLAQELRQRGVELHEHGSQLGQSLHKAQQQAEVALHRIRRLESELEQASQQLQQDPLTGALNRRGLDVAFVRDSTRAAEQQRPLSVALLDLDHFKQINDSYGHDFGDEVLRGLVQVARKLVRPGDSIARMGGEEFMMLFPDTDADAAQRATERLLQGFRNRRVLHRSTGQRVEMTFSAGVAQFHGSEAFGELYERADLALRQAKQGGRQQVVQAAPRHEP
uniref:GGDEF domain-containing protein n=1 Tax=Thiomonas sp. TaxID=2047785 RepID=UPI00260BE9E6